MHLRSNCVAIVAILFSYHFASAQFSHDFFWSDKAQDQGAINGNMIFDAQVGDEVTLYAYWTTNGPSDSGIDLGCGVDVSTSQPGIIRFESAETLDFDVVIPAAGNVTVGSRWQNSIGGGSYSGAGYSGPASEVTDDAIDQLWAFTLGNYGIFELNNGVDSIFLDEGYDAGADAFLWGKLTFTAIAPGLVEIITVTDETNCIDGPNALNVVHSTVAINVTGNKVMLGDMNLDGVVDLLDIQPFTFVIDNQLFQAEADTNQDGIVNLLDIQPFIELLLD